MTSGPRTTAAGTGTLQRVARALLAALVVSGTLSFARADVDVDEVPTAVVRAVQERFPGARIVEADLDRLDPHGRPRTVTTYELKCDLPDREIEVLVTADGAVLDEEFSMRPKRGVELKLSAEEVAEDLEFLGTALDARFAYRHANGVDLDASLAGIRKRGRDGMKRDGYLPLPRMNDDAAERVATWMPRFAETNGLIIDVRGNGGGSRDALLALYPWLMGEDEAPRVLSVAKYRLWEGFSDDHMDGRFMKRADDERLTKDERATAAAFLKTFEPEWDPPEQLFSEWHALIVSRGVRRHGAPVVVLMDDRCFSATDIFLGALKGRPNVTLMGRPSGGGSAYSQRFTLPRSGLEIRCASMASFTPQGQLYDLHGIEPDVSVEVAPEYFLLGNDDELLARAFEHLQR